MLTRYTKTYIPPYCRYHTEWPKEAFLPAQFQGVQKGHVDALQDTVRVRHARDVAQDRQYLAGDGQRRQTGSKKGSGAALQQELRPVEDKLGDAPVPPRGPGAREGAGAGPLQDFLPDEH
jgi:hypothetical protein